MAGVSGDWLINQWTSDMCVLDGIDPSVLLKQTKQGNRTGRRIGVHFARVGLPKFAFGPLFSSLALEYPGFLDKVASTQGYYWVNASWGVTTSPGQFISVNEKTRKVDHTAVLQDVMRRLGGQSSLGIATVAVSVTFEVINDGSAKPPPNRQKAGLSVKLHNFCQSAIVDYHGPQQQLASSMKVPQRILDRARGLAEGPMRGSSGGMSSVFSLASTTNNTRNEGMTAPSTKTTDSTAFMT